MISLNGCRIGTLAFISSYHVPTYVHGARLNKIRKRGCAAQTSLRGSQNLNGELIIECSALRFLFIQTDLS